jgi:hypothetical protein
MTIWTPDWKVLIDGEEITDATLANLSITSGRTDIFNQPAAGYCSVNLINLSNAIYGWGINTQIAIEVKDSTGSFVPIFGGWISDINIGVQNAGAAAVVTNAAITATGALSKLQKIITPGVLAKDYEGNQIYSLLEDYLYGTWNDVPAATTWATYNPTTTWANAQNQGIGEIDMPGDYELIARSTDDINLYDLISQLATSAFGYIYEDAQGNIGYADTTHRQDYLAANGYTTLTAGAAAFAGISTTQRIGDIRNKLILNYGTNYNSQVTKENTTSQTDYGLYSTQESWNLHNTADANSLGQRYVDLRSIPYQRFQSITFDLGNPEIDDSDRDALIGIFMGLPVQISGLPQNIATNGVFEGYVEGWSFRASYNGLQITFNASPIAFNQVAINWTQVSALEYWNTLSTTLTWEQAIGAVS